MSFKHLPVCVPAALPHCHWIYLPVLTAGPWTNLSLFTVLKTYVQCHLVQLFIVSCWNINKNGPSQSSFYHGPTPLSYTAPTAKMHPERSSCLYSTPVCVLQTRARWVAPWADRTLGHSTLQSCGQMSPCSRSEVIQFFSSIFQFQFVASTASFLTSPCPAHLTITLSWLFWKQSCHCPLSFWSSQFPLPQSPSKDHL